MLTVALIVEVIFMLVQHVQCCRAESVMKMGIHLQPVRQKQQEENNRIEFDTDEKICRWKELSTIILNIALKI